MGVSTIAFCSAPPPPDPKTEGAGYLSKSIFKQFSIIKSGTERGRSFHNFHPLRVRAFDRYCLEKDRFRVPEQYRKRVILIIGLVLPYMVALFP